MSKRELYLLVGRGRWASVIHRVLLQEQHQVVTLDESRARVGEGEREYRRRLESSLAQSKASVAWLCLPYGGWTPQIVEAALSAGLDVIAECPWLAPPDTTDCLLDQQRREGRLIAVHYEYCMLDEVIRWRHSYSGGEGYTFNGNFSISRPGKYGAVARLQLGSHLLAIHNYAMPLAAVGKIECAFESVERRAVWIERAGVQVAAIDFLGNQQPVIQRFLHAFEAARNGGDLPLSLNFAKQVAAKVMALRPAL